MAQTLSDGRPLSDARTLSDGRPLSDARTLSDGRTVSDSHTLSDVRAVRPSVGWTPLQGADSSPIDAKANEHRTLTSAWTTESVPTRWLDSPAI
ncbi:MAG TPA: hypothetical protein VFQ53_04155 [Kofleriaceae bacterium]|nr:hypothetical protein [Kofleriaceae bacterium]